ncbi:hypothetical protein [Streptosporangium longisporum]|uniref:Uncharacterized protein n=1 Tax=Streptosporangium longisporum TaxID=46187 RepID=A0ABN3YDZ1_9ACTN
MPPNALAGPNRQVYPLFWWWLAFTLSAWNLAIAFFPTAGLIETISCSWVGTKPSPESRWEWMARLAPVESHLTFAMPVALGLCIWLIAARGAGRPRVHQWTAFTAVVLVVVDHGLEHAMTFLDPLPEDASCSVDPATLNAVGWEQTAWTLAPAVLVLIGAATGVRGPARPRPRPSWRAVTAVLVVVATVVAVVAVRLIPGPVTEAAIRAADGTSRYALVNAGNRLVVLDLTEGTESGVVPAPDRRFHRYTSVVADGEPGWYLAAVTTAWRGAFGRQASRIYRVALDGFGGATVGDQVGGDLEGRIGDLAVSPQGRVAYSRVVTAPDDPGEIATTVAGIAGERREWSAPGGHGLGDSRDGALGLHWRDENRLVFRAFPRKARSPRLVMLDVRRPGTDLLAAETLQSMPSLGDGIALTLPGRGRTVVLQTEPGSGWGGRLLLVEPSARRPVGAILSLGCGSVVSFAPDSSGRYLLVGVDNAAGVMTGDPPEPICGDAPPYELFRVDLDGTSGSPAPDAYPGDVPSLNLPGRRIWQGERALDGIAW